MRLAHPVVCDCTHDLCGSVYEKKVTREGEERRGRYGEVWKGREEGKERRGAEERKVWRGLNSPVYAGLCMREEDKERGEEGMERFGKGEKRLTREEEEKRERC